MPSRIDMVGQRYGRLQVLADAPSESTPQARRVLARCDCGTERILNARSVRRGNTQSCGCLQPARATSHGLDAHPLCAVWRAMRGRCYHRSQRSYRYYGARGIRVCDQWRHSPEQFIEWAEQHGWQPGLQIDRIDVDGDYSPENCRFVTARENTNNTRANRVITVDGVAFTLAEAARKYGIPYATLQQRITRLGWAPERAVQS